MEREKTKCYVNGKALQMTLHVWSLQTFVKWVRISRQKMFQDVFEQKSQNNRNYAKIQ